MADNTPAGGVHVEANATSKCTLDNLLGNTIVLVARWDDNAIAVNDHAQNTVEVTLKLLRSSHRNRAPASILTMARLE
jgi:hypothetical protein